MPRVCAGDVTDPATLGTAYTRGHGIPITWKRQAPCSKTPRVASIRKGGNPSWWLVEPQEIYVYGDDVVEGDQLQELALQMCAMCPVQWDCVSAAVRANEPWGIWGVMPEDLARLTRMHGRRAETLIRQAEADGQPVQFAMSRRRRSGQTRISA